MSFRNLPSQMWLGLPRPEQKLSFSPTNSFRNFAPPPVSNQPANRCNLFPATNSKASVHNIPFCRALPWSCWPSSLPWTLAPVRSTSHPRSEEHTSELQSLRHLVCRLLLEKKKENKIVIIL